MENVKQKLTAIALAGTLAATPLASAEPVGSAQANDDPLFQSQIEHSAKEMAYNNFIENEDIRSYDVDFVNFFRTGTLKLYGNEYSLADIYLETCMKDNASKQFFIFYKYPNNDIITGESKEGYKRVDVIELRRLFGFYLFFTTYRAEVVDNSLDLNSEMVIKLIEFVAENGNTIHVETPETAYGRIKSN